VTATTCGVLAGLVDLGGWAETIAAADPARIARLSSPVTKSIEEQLASVMADTRAFIAKAAEVAKPDSEATLRASTGATVREAIAQAMADVALWRDRLSLTAMDASLYADETLAALAKEADEADKAALAADEARRKARKAARDAEKAAAKGADFAALDDEQAREERAAAKAATA
jgi:hypothetical protein